MSVGRSVGWSVGRLHLISIAYFAVSRLLETHYCPCPTARDLDSRVYGLVELRNRQTFQSHKTEGHFRVTRQGLIVISKFESRLQTRPYTRLSQSRAVGQGQ